MLGMFAISLISEDFLSYLLVRFILDSACGCACAHVNTHIIAHVEVPGEPAGVSYLRLQCGFQEFDSGLQVL